MFSGIVEEIGVVIQSRRRGPGATMTVQAHHVLQGTQVGDSLAINGVCLTVTALHKDRFTVDLAPETLRRTNLGQLRPGMPVNLERALAVGDRLGGHFVLGHVDATGTVRSLHPEGEALIIAFNAPPTVLRYVVPKGCIAVDGVSLTVVARDANGFTVSFIPYTLQHTIAQHYRPGTTVNLEADILGKYVEQFITSR